MKNMFFNFFKKSQPKVHARAVPFDQKVQQKTEVKPEIKITTKTAEEYDEGETTNILSHLDFNSSVEGLGRFLNYQKYFITGINENGKRKIASVTGVDSQQAIESAVAKGVLPPFDVEIAEHEPPTERQLEYLKRNGIIFLNGITKDDASCMISRVSGEDSEESPEPYLVALANGLKIKFSAFIGAKGLFNSIIYQANDRDRAALYAYAVRQSMRGRSFGNMLEDSEVSVFYAFADQVANNSTLMHSLSDRPVEDYKKPYRGTAIYKAAAAFLDSEMNEK